jgi:Anaphase promoting complex subunit 8 / Cdc23
VYASARRVRLYQPVVGFEALHDRRTRASTSYKLQLTTTKIHERGEPEKLALSPVIRSTTPAVSVRSFNNSFGGLSFDKSNSHPTRTCSPTMSEKMAVEYRQPLFADLMQTVKDCSDRGLYQSAKWQRPLPDEGADRRAAEAMNAMEMEARQVVMSADFDNALSLEERELEVVDLPKYLLGKSYFDCKEYERAAFALKGCQSLRCTFLRLYSKFLVRLQAPHTLLRTCRLVRYERRRKDRKYWGRWILNECQTRKFPLSSRNSKIWHLIKISMRTHYICTSHVSGHIDIDSARHEYVITKRRMHFNLFSLASDGVLTSGVPGRNSLRSLQALKL